MIALIPLHGGHGPDGWEDSSFAIMPFVGTFLLLLALLGVLTALYLWRQGKLTLPQLGRAGSPDHEARRILAERFARGDISSEDFLERASILNWTPGSDQLTSKRGKKRG